MPHILYVFHKVIEIMMFSLGGKVAGPVINKFSIVIFVGIESRLFFVSLGMLLVEKVLYFFQLFLIH